MTAAAAALGTLAPTGIFSPGDVKAEAELLHSATLALQKSLIQRSEDASLDLYAAWNAFVDDEKDFYGRSQSFFYWLDFADNGARDQVLALEKRFNSLKSEIGALKLESTGNVIPLNVQPAFSDDDDRASHSLFREKGGVVDDVTSAVDKAVDKARDALGSTLFATAAAALAVIVPLGIVVVLVARSGAVKVGV